LEGPDELIPPHTGKHTTFGQGQASTPCWEDKIPLMYHGYHAPS